MKNTEAFTLVELMVVIAIIAILAVGSITSYDSYIEKSRLSSAVTNYKIIKDKFLTASYTASSGNLFSGWYNFDKDGSVNAVSPYILDSSGAENHLVSRSGSTNYSQNDETPMKSGKSLFLKNRHLSIAGTVPGGPVDKITMAMWVRLESGTTDTYPLFISSNTGFNIKTDRSLRFYINGSNSDQISTEKGIIKDDTWYYLVGSHNGNTNTMKLWLDGKLIGTKTITQTKSFEGDGIYLGYGSFQGWIDEVMIFPYAFDGENLN